jgi:hypothetical protein
LEQDWVQQIRSAQQRFEMHSSEATWMRPSPARQHPLQRAEAARAGHTSGVERPVSPAAHPLPVVVPPVVHAPAAGLASPADVHAHVAPAAVVRVPAAANAVPADRVVLQTSDAHLAWRRLWSCPADHHCKVLGWRLLHASLPVRASTVAKRGGEPAAARCQHGACKDRGRSAPFETYTHAFLECPASAQAVAWLRDLWAAIAGSRPPDDTLVLLGDHAPSWPAFPRSRPRQQLWTFLRLTVLYHIWDSRCRALPPEQQSAEAVVRRCIHSIVATMQQLFYRSTRKQHMIEHLPHSLLTEDVASVGLEGFLLTWCDGDALCSVLPGAAGEAPRLVVRLSEAHPVRLAGLG